MTIVARWEWRCFGDDFAQAEALIKKHGEPFSRESAEVYVVSKRKEDNTKIRDELMDIKTLQRVDDKGLEQWFPVMKNGFPLPRTELEKVCDSWGVPLPDFDGDAIAYDALIAQFVGAHDDLCAVDVVKKRHGFKMGEAIVEIAEILIDGKLVRSICVEHPDPDLVWNTVGELGLRPLENVNYLKAIKRAIGWEA